jgi:aspartate/glutamate racemase
MTTLLKKAFETVSKLPDIEQNKLARWIIEELEADKKWSNSFAESEDILEKLADETVEIHKQGKTSNLNIDQL